MALVFIGLFIQEQCFPLRSRCRPIRFRLFVNLLISGLALGAGAISVKPVASLIMGWNQNQAFGLLSRVELPPLLELLIGFLLLDLSFYYWHRLNHKVPLLWRFHNVHHLDPDLDISTSFRFHFVDVLYSTLFRVVQIALIGVSPTTFLLFELCFQGSTMFHHSNLKLPIGLERIWNRVMVTPRMHGIHHSIREVEANSNYSVIFSWWDRIHRTLRLNIPQQNVTIGVPAYLSQQDNHFSRLMIMPFRRQRDYWAAPDRVDNEEKRTESSSHVLSYLEE